MPTDTARHFQQRKVDKYWDEWVIAQGRYNRLKVTKHVSSEALERARGLAHQAYVAYQEQRDILEHWEEYNATSSA